MRGNRPLSTLSIWGMTTPDRYEKLLKFLPPSMTYGAKTNEQGLKTTFCSELRTGPDRFIAARKGRLARTRVSFALRSEPDPNDETLNGFGKLWLYHAPTKAFFFYPTRKDELFVLQEDLDKDEDAAIRNANACHEFFQEGKSVGLQLISSRHEAMDALIRNQDLRAYLGGPSERKTPA